MKKVTKRKVSGMDLLKDAGLTRITTGKEAVFVLLVGTEGMPIQEVRNAVVSRHGSLSAVSGETARGDADTFLDVFVQASEGYWFRDLKTAEDRRLKLLRDRSNELVAELQKVNALMLSAPIRTFSDARTSPGRRGG